MKIPGMSLPGENTAMVGASSTRGALFSGRSAASNLLKILRFGVEIVRIYVVSNVFVPTKSPKIEKRTNVEKMYKIFSSSAKRLVAGS